MDTVRTQAIINWLANNPESTVTAIAKGALGVTKAREGLKRLIAEMVESGDITKNQGSRYETYTSSTSTDAVAPTSNVEIAAATTEEPATTPNASANSSRNIVASTPKLQGKHLEGYSAATNNGQITITCPTGIEVELGDGEALLVINGQPSYGVVTAKDVLSCISAYANEQQMRQFVVTDMATGNLIGDEGDINLGDRVLAVEIQRHNKAA